MAKNKQMCDLTSTKGFPRGWSNEQLRNFSAQAFERKRSGNFDPTRQKLNFEVTKGGIITPVDQKHSINHRISENLRRRGIIDPNAGKEKPDKRTVANFVLGGSREQMHRLAFGDQKIDLNHGADNSSIVRQKAIEDWAIDTYNFMARKYGEENVVSFVVHLDEINPHVHCTVLPVTEQNKISWKKVMAGKDKYEYRDRMLKLHDEFAEVNKKYGLERGDAVAVTGAKHRSTEEYRDWLDNQARKLEIKIDTQKQTLYEINAEIAKAEKRVKALYTMLSNLEAQKKDIEDRISTLESQLESQARQSQLTNEEITRRRQVLIGELDTIAAKINERQSQLVKARQQLQDVADRKSQLEQKTQVVEKQLRQNQNEYSNKVMRDMENTAWGEVARDMKRHMAKYEEYRDTLGLDERRNIDNLYDNVFDGSIFDQMAENANEVIAVASALFMGYLDGAVSFAESHGGGGDSPGSDWGRDKDDDDETWRRKCFHMGMKMMRPSPGKLSRRNTPRQQAKGLGR